MIGDEARLRQILFNLVGNAVKFTENGRVRVEAALLPYPGESSVKVLFTVSDTGIGIKDDQLTEIFEPFVQAEEMYSRRFQGAGLGLSIVKKLVRLMHGELAIENAPGNGTVFYFSLPFDLPKVAENQTVTPLQTMVRRSASRYNVLLVEDEVISSMACKRMLEKEGHFVVAAKNGLEAVQSLSEQPFDLILMDIQMPLMDGVEATRIIRSSDSLASKSKIPIIAMTAYTMLGDREKFLDAGMNDYLAKPIDKDGMLDTIARAMVGKTPN